MDLPRDLRAVITGAGSGLGRALALEVARRGGRAVLGDLNGDTLRQSVELVRAAGAEAWPIECDVRDVEQVRSLALEADRRMGGTDLLANNAGVAASGLAEEIPLEDWKWVLDIDLWGVIHGCHVFLPRMKAQERGYILNVASMAGLVSPPNVAPYNVAKAGVIALTETLHAEAMPAGVHVTAVCPSFFRTRIAEHGRGVDGQMRDLTHRLMERSRVQAPEVARLALDAVARGELYALPMQHGRVVWRVKRALPAEFHGLIARYRDRLESYFR